IINIGWVLEILLLPGMVLWLVMFRIISGERSSLAQDFYLTSKWLLPWFALISSIITLGYTFYIQYTILEELRLLVQTYITMAIFLTSIFSLIIKNSRLLILLALAIISIPCYFIISDTISLLHFDLVIGLVTIGLGLFGSFVCILV